MHILIKSYRNLLGYVKGCLRRGVFYVVEKHDWSIKHDGDAIIGHLKQLRPDLFCKITTSGSELYKQIVHFGSIWSFVNNIKKTHKSNRLIVTVFHGHPDLSQEMEQAFNTLWDYLPTLDGIVVANQIMQNRLLEWGVPKNKLHVIPLGVDLKLFRPPNQSERLKHRHRLGIPDDVICIGSFQKDGIGWEEGLKPKLMKGPDIFLEVVKQLSQKYPIFVLLTGPARGYVKEGLKTNNIPYRHDYVDFETLPSYYHCLDLYIVTSREEGGPKAILESMATGVPLISTRVGMAPDIIKQGVNGIMIEIDDINGLVQAAQRLIEDPDLRNRIATNALQTVKNYDWTNIVRLYYEKIYAPLL